MSLFAMLLPEKEVKEYQETKAKFAFVKFMPLLAPLLWGFTVTQQCTDRQAD